LSVRVRRDKEQDRPALRQVNRRAFEAAYSHIFAPDELEGMFSGRLPQSSTGRDNREGLLGVLVAEVEGEVVGFATLARLKDGDGELQAFYVLPEYQGQGVGSALWERSLEALGREGFAGMQIWVLADVDAVAFYERRRCAKIGEGTYAIGDHSERTLRYRISLAADS
jgi:GNAT superfamily N-acetyltransferase